MVQPSDLTQSDSMIPLDELENSGATRDGAADADAKRLYFLASPCFNPYRGRTAHAHTA